MPGHPGAEAAVGDVNVVVRAGVDGDGKLGCGQFGDGDPAGLAWLTDGLEDGHDPSALGEQLVGVAAAGRAGAFDGGERRVEFCHRVVVPGVHLVSPHDTASTQSVSSKTYSPRLFL